ncbi:MAG: type IX secretion system membrane protein PorP/SprF [Pedobacter sp.]|nr:type IX secretion system membrane protein PorP/SprF [Pedobacter sp.]
MLRSYTKYLRKIGFVGWLCLINSMANAQQDAQYSQYMFNGLYVNPAYAGYRDATYAQAFYRSQWTGIKGAPESLSFSFDTYIEDKKIGLGVILSKDKIGAQSMLNGYLTFAYRLRLSEDPNNTLSFGLGAGILQTGLDGSLLEPGELNDIRIPTALERKTAPDLRAGLQFTMANFFVGLSVNNLFSHQANQITNAPVYLTAKSHYYLTSAAIFPLQDGLKLKPSFLIKDDWHGPASLDLNTFFIFKDAFSIGATYRTSIQIFPRKTLEEGLTKRSAIGLLMDFLVQKRFRIGYAFDYSLNQLANYEHGSHEISLGYYFSPPKERSRLFYCF